MVSLKNLTDPIIVLMLRLPLRMFVLKVANWYKGEEKPRFYC